MTPALCRRGASGWGDSVAATAERASDDTFRHASWPVAVRLLLALALSLGLVSHAPAQQLSFRHEPAGESVALSWRFRDAAGQVADIAIRLPTAEVESALASLRTFSLPDLYGHLEIAAVEAGRRDGVTVTPRREGAGVAFRIEGSDQRRLSAFQGKLGAILENAREGYLRRHLRRAEGPNIYVDHVAATLKHAPVLRGLAQALAIEGEERSKVALAMTFLQAIPYDDFTDPRTTGGIDFAAPPAMLRINKGDCDGKSVALAALLRTLVPARKLAFVIVPNHVFLAIDLPVREGDATILHEGVRYVVLEPTGPDFAPPGVAGQQSAWFIANPGPQLTVLPVR